jgi:cytochrome P450
MLGSFIHLTKEEAGSETLDVRIILSYHEHSAKSCTSLVVFDTTATAIRATILYITTNPRAYAKLLAEVSSTSPSSPIQDANVSKLPFLLAVIKEGLRSSLFSPHA